FPTSLSLTSSLAGVAGYIGLYARFGCIRECRTTARRYRQQTTRASFRASPPTSASLAPPRGPGEAQGRAYGPRLAGRRRTDRVRERRGRGEGRRSPLPRPPALVRVMVRDEGQEPPGPANDPRAPGHQDDPALRSPGPGPSPQ